MRRGLPAILFATLVAGLVAVGAAGQSTTTTTTTTHAPVGTVTPSPAPPPTPTPAPSCCAGNLYDNIFANRGFGAIQLNDGEGILAPHGAITVATWVRMI